MHVTNKYLNHFQADICSKPKETNLIIHSDDILAVDFNQSVIYKQTITRCRWIFNNIVDNSITESESAVIERVLAYSKASAPWPIANGENNFLGRCIF